MTLDDVVSHLQLISNQLEDLKIFALAVVVGLAFLFVLQLVWFAPKFLSGWWR